jgi:hypothetical protein
MRNFITTIICVLCLSLVFSCKKNEPSKAAGAPVTIETRSIQKTKGTDCDKQPDSLRTDCAIVDFTLPKLAGTSALAKGVDTWVDNYLLHLINWAIASEDGKAPKTVDDGIKHYFDNHDENAGSISSGQYALTCTNEEVLNDGKYLTLRLNGYAFTGGNRSLDDVAIASFDAKTGKQLTWADLVKDQKALLPIAQAKVKEMREDAFREGFTFDKEEPFALPQAYGLTTDGILMHYTTGEIYQLGGQTEFTVYFNELGNNLKVAAPAVPKEADSDEDVFALYEVKGNDMVIFPFEIEVANSAAADKTLTKKKETLIVSASLWGVPKDPKEKAKGEDGMVSFVDKDIELTGDNRLARFEGLTFNKSLLSKVEDKDIFLLINVFSGRKSSQDNLLTCGILDTKVSQVVNKRFVLGCKLIEEPEKVGPNMVNPLACYALPDFGEAPAGSVSFLVNCDSVGNIAFAGSPMKDLDALKATLRPLLKDWQKKDAKNLPGIETEGCMMGNSGAIRDMYDELTAELTGKAKPADKPEETEKTGVKTDTKKDATAKPSTKTDAAAKPTTGKTTSTKSTSSTTTAPTKQAPVKSTKPVVTLKQNGDMLLDGKAVGTFEALRKQLQTALLAQATIPEKVELKTVGETGMGARAEVNSVIAESIKGAKWLRKKAAIATLNTAVGKRLATTTQLELGNYETSGNFAYISAGIKGADGKAVDYSKTDYAKDIAAGKFTEYTVGLLKYENGAWKLLTYNIGTSKPPVDAWVKSYKAPKGLFGKAK